jgi:hypothetical protein
MRAGAPLPGWLTHPNQNYLRELHMKLQVLLAVTAISLIACANRPDSIRASHVSYEKFTHLDCAALTIKMASTRADLDKFSKMQDTKANGDAFGVFLLGIPFSKLSGDHEGDVARLKGEVEAIETAQVKGQCTAESKTTKSS